jgi:riboflavin kinase/FMN adenylyltransferase
LPARGVYAVRARTDGGLWHNAVANLGVRPTFDGRGFLVEVHLLDFSGDLYGSEMEVSFVQRLRGEQQFKNSEELAKQIHHDVKAARESLV